VAARRRAAGCGHVRADRRPGRACPGADERYWAAYFPMDGHRLANAQPARLGLENRKGVRSPAN
jgi:hypothetical protein